MNSYSKFTISILFTIALTTGFLSMPFVQRAHAFSIDLGDIHMNFDNLHGSTGPQGPQGPQGEQGPKGDKGDTGAPCPHQSKLASQTGDGHAAVDVLNPSTPGDNNVCVP